MYFIPFNCNCEMCFLYLFVLHTDPKSKYLFLTLYFGGTFKNMALTEYVGGDYLVFDWVKADEIAYSDLDEYGRTAMVKGARRYQLRMKNMSFKLLIDDDDDDIRGQKSIWLIENCMSLLNICKKKMRMSLKKV